MMEPRRADDGFTLTELLVFIVLLGMILSVAYGGYYVVSNGVTLSDRQAHFVQEISGPLDEFERIVMQQNRMLTDYPNGPGPFQLMMWTDMDSDDHYETHFLQATGDGTLVFTRSEEVDAPTPWTFVMSTHNANVSAGVPLFTFYDANGDEISDMSVVASQAYSVKITIVTEYDGQQYSDSRRVLFRN